MFNSMEFFQSFLSPSSSYNKSKSKQSRAASSPKMKKRKQDTPPKQMDQARQGRYQRDQTKAENRRLSSARKQIGVMNGSCHGKPSVPSNVDRKLWEMFNSELDQVTSWLDEATQFTQCWQAPAHNIPSIRVQLERHLAFSLEVQTHQNQTERIVFQGHDIIEQSPNVSSSLQPRLDAVISQWNHLEKSVNIQAKQIKEALAVVETTIDTGFTGSTNDLLVEETRDAIDFMRMKLRRNQGRSSPVNVTISQSANNSEHTISKKKPVQSSRYSPVPSNNSSCSSSPDFEVLYNELSDWLNDMHLAVTDSGDMRVSEHHKQHMCKGYEQEMQLREVSRSKLQRKGLQLMASKPGMAQDIGSKLEALNQQWQMLQQHLAPSPLLARKSNNSRGTPAFSSSEQAMSLALEVEDVIVQLKAWLTQMESRLFDGDSNLETADLSHLKSRLSSIQDLKADIDSHSKGIDVVLKLCSLLQDDEQYSCSNQREKESLQLGAINVERRWQNVKTQSAEMLQHTQEKVDVMKGLSSGSSSGDEQRSDTPELPFIMEESSDESDVEAKQAPVTEKQSSVTSIQERYHPSGAKDDDVVDGYANRVHGHGRTLEYEDILLAREAFSENDAFSISDASEVSVEDFAFDDHLPLKNEEEEEEEEDEIEDDDDLALSLSETPDIMELTDEMLDAYLQLEEELILEAEAEAEEEEKTSQAAAALEFWSMSPREDASLNSEIERMRASLKQQEEEEEESFQKMCGTYCDAVSSLEKRRLDSVGSDFLSEEAEEALECLASDEDFGDEYDGELDDDDDDDCFLYEDEENDITLPGEETLQEDEQNLANDDYGGWMTGSMDDVGVYPDFLEMERFSNQEISSEESSVESKESDAKCDEDGYKQELCEPSLECDSLYSSDTKNSNEEDESSTPLLHTWPQDGHLFPPLAEESSSDSLLSSLRSLTSAPYFKTSNFFPSLVATDDEDKVENDSPPVLSRRRSSFGQRRHSRKWSFDYDEDQTKNKEKDNLLEITDISLSHMYESLDFVTELVHRIAPENRSGFYQQDRRFDNYTEAVDEAKINTPHTSHDSFDVVSQIVRQMVPSATSSTTGEETDVASKHTHAEQEVIDSNQSEELSEQAMQEGESPKVTTLSASLPLSHSTVRDCSHICTGSFNFTWPTTTTCENSECKKIATIQAAVKQTLSKALLDVDNETMVAEDPSKDPTAANEHSKPHLTSTMAGKTTQKQGIEESCGGSCDTGFGSLMSDEGDAISSPNVTKVQEVEAPCTLIDSGLEESTPTKAGYMSYISQLAEACSEGNLDKYLSNKQHKQCYLWSVPPAAEDTPEEAAIKREIENIERNVQDMLLSTEELQTKWEVDSQGTDNTDRLMEATNNLVEELKSGSSLDVDLEESQVGSWKDVIVLWMDKNGKVRDAETHGCTPITVSPNYMQEEDGNMCSMLKEVPFMAQSEMQQEAPGSVSSLSQSGLDSVDYPVTGVAQPRLTRSLVGNEGAITHKHDAWEQYEAPVQSKSYCRRLLGIALPIHLLLFLCTVLVLVLPSVITSPNNDTYFSLTDNLMLDLHNWGPIVNYVRGPPPV